MVGIFIGSFNPITSAHLEICKKLKKRYQKIILVPVNTTNKHLISWQDRISMLNIIKHKYPFIEIDTIMDNYSFLNYRIIDLLKKRYQKMELIIGSDLLEKIDTFDNYSYLLQNYSFMVVTRFKMDVKKIIQEKYLLYQNNFHVLEFNNNTSSSLVREKIKNNDNLKGLLDKDVLEYIKKNYLYV